MAVEDTMFGRRSLTTPVPCEYPMHEGRMLPAMRFLGMECPACHTTYDVLLCAECYHRIPKRGVRCKCGALSPGGMWYKVDHPITGPLTIK